MKISEVSKFRFLTADSPMPPKNTVVIVKHPGLKRGEYKAPIACGKIFWQNQMAADGEDPSILISIRGEGKTAELRLTKAEFTEFRPLAIIVN